MLYRTSPSVEILVRASVFLTSITLIPFYHLALAFYVSSCFLCLPCWISRHLGQVAIRNQTVRASVFRGVSSSPTSAVLDVERSGRFRLNKQFSVSIETTGFSRIADGLNITALGRMSPPETRVRGTRTSRIPYHSIKLYHPNLW